MPVLAGRVSWPALGKATGVPWWAWLGGLAGAVLGNWDALLMLALLAALPIGADRAPAAAPESTAVAKVSSVSS